MPSLKIQTPQQNTTTLLPNQMQVNYKLYLYQRNSPTHLHLRWNDPDIFYEFIMFGNKENMRRNYVKIIAKRPK